MNKKETLEKLYQMVVKKTYKTIIQILFNPTKKQSKKFWCNNCDGFHPTNKCNEKTK